MGDLLSIVEAWEAYGEAQDVIREQQEHCPHCHGAYIERGEPCRRCARLDKQAKQLVLKFLAMWK